MSSLDEVTELLGFLADRRDDLRTLAAQHVLALTGTKDGVELLVRADAAEVLCRRIGDIDEVSKAAVSALINLSESPKALGQMLKKNAVGRLMDGLKESECRHKRLNVMLLSNLCQAPSGCSQLMGMQETEKVLIGMHFRRLLQWFLAPVPSSAVGTENDVYEYAGEVLCNVTQIKEARAIVLEAERGILPALIPQLQSSSVVRRRGAAGVMRNCCFEQERFDYLVSDGLKLVIHMVLPLVGPEPFDDDDKPLMPSQWLMNQSTKRREPDARVRRQIVESLVLLCANARGRKYLRDMKVYPVVKALHVWIEENCRIAPLKALTAGDDSDIVGDLALVKGTGHGAGHGGEEEPPLCPDDEATVEAIIQLVDFLMRKEEGEAPDVPVPTPAPTQPKVVEVTEDDSEDDTDLAGEVD